MLHYLQAESNDVVNSRHQVFFPRKRLLPVYTQEFLQVCSKTKQKNNGRACIISFCLEELTCYKNTAYSKQWKIYLKKKTFKSLINWMLFYQNQSKHTGQLQRTENPMKQ